VRFPIVLKTRARYRAPARLFYEVAANGIFQVRDTGIFRSVTQAEVEVPGLLASQEEVVLRFPRLPAWLLEDVLAFFREAYRQHGGEAIVILFYRPEDREFRAEAPSQSIPGYRDGAGVFRAHHQLRYGQVERPEGFVRMGSIHSHAQSPAYASAVDCADEQGEDGLHVVFGDVDLSRPSRSACFVSNGVRFQLEPDRVLEPCEVPMRPARADWMARLRREESAWSWSMVQGGARAGGS
jgi:proteasome lid subunit RPN8/RPN11